MSEQSYLDYSQALYRAVYTVLDHSTTPAEKVLRSSIVFVQLYRMINVLGFFIFTAWALMPMVYELILNWLAQNPTVDRDVQVFHAITFTLMVFAVYIGLIITPLDQLKKYKRFHSKVATPYITLVPALGLFLGLIGINYLDGTVLNYNAWTMFQVYMLIVGVGAFLSSLVAFGLLTLVRRMPRILLMILSTTSGCPPLSIPSHEQLLTQAEVQVRKILQGCSPLTVRNVRTVIDARRDSNNHQIQVFAFFGGGFGIILSAGAIRLDAITYLLDALNRNMSQLFGETAGTVDGTPIQVLAAVILIAVAIFTCLYVDLAYKTTRVLEIISVLCTVLLDEAEESKNNQPLRDTRLASGIILPSVDVIQAVIASKQLNISVSNNVQQK
jgi:hypothetical protein